MQTYKQILLYFFISLFSIGAYQIYSKSTEDNVYILLESEYLSKFFTFVISFLKFPISTIKHFILFENLDSKIQSNSTIYFDFIPSFFVNVRNNQTTNFTSDCFTNNSIISTSNNFTTNIKILVSNPKSIFCQDTYLLANIKEYFVKSIWKSGSYDFNIKNTNNSPYLFKFNGSPIQTIYSFIKTLKLFSPFFHKNGYISYETEKENINFLKKSANITMPKIDNIYLNLLNPKLINSGDLLVIMRLDGLLPTEGLGMGSGTGHMATTLWIDNELYVIESTDKTNYWPFHGIQKNKWFDWIKLAYESNFIVEYLPLSDEMKEIFDNESAVKWFKEVEGMPYGYNNYFFCWLDTTEDNYPNPLSSQFLEILMGHISQHFPSISQKMWNHALNKRLDCNFNSTEKILEYSYNKNINFTELMKIPEMDYWQYDGNFSMVCSVFVCSVWKKAGLFKNLADKIQCTEFHNWDVYSLNFFNQSKSNNTNDWIHIMGNYRLDLSGANTKEPYERMAEKCPSKPPLYIRPDKC